MKKSVEILGLPVISITEGRELGMSKTLLIDAKNGNVAAITIEDEDWYRGVKLIPYESVIAIGDDAVTVTNSENILKLEEASDYENLLDENIRVIGTKAITKNGTIQGKISEVFVGDNGEIEKCEVTAPDGTTTEIAADQISIFGKQVTVIDPDGEKKNDLIQRLMERSAPKPPKAEPVAPEPVQEEVAPIPEPVPAAEEIPMEPPVMEPPVMEEVAPEVPAEVPAAEEIAPEIPVEAPVVEETAPGVSVEAPAVEEIAPEVPVEVPAAEEIAPEVPVEAPAAEEVAPEVPVEVPAAEEVVPEIPEIPVEAPVVEEVAPEAPVEVPAAEEIAPEVPAEAPVVEEVTPKVSVEAPAHAVAEAAPEAPKAAPAKAEPMKQAPKAAPAKTAEVQKKQAADKATEERHRRFLLGKKAARTIKTDTGIVIVEAGADITEEVLQKAKLANKFIELSMNVQ